MQESRKHRYERERRLIIALHDSQGYSFNEIGKMPQFRVTPAAIYKRYKKQKGRDSLNLGG